MRDHGILAATQEWDTRDTLSDSTLWAARDVSPIDEKVASRTIQILTSAWPFSSGPPRVPAVGETDTLGNIAEQVTRGHWDRERSHTAAIEYFAARGDTEDLIMEYRALIAIDPFDVGSYLTLATFQLEQGDTNGMQSTLLASLRVEPTPVALKALADRALRAGNVREAISLYEELAPLPQSPRERAEAGLGLALAYVKEGRTVQAEAELERVLRIQPSYRPARDLLAMLRRPGGKP